MIQLQIFHLLISTCHSLYPFMFNDMFNEYRILPVFTYVIATIKASLILFHKVNKTKKLA